MFGRYGNMIDRLQQREWSDRWIFLLFALIGSMAIWLAKAVGLDAFIVALGAIGAMLAYAALANLGPSLKMRADQIGDNCYYLGLVFTLASLSYAIFTFDPADTATTIVQGFGVALVSTVLGLVLRVFFSQGRPDLAMAEDNARLALTETAVSVRAELDGVLLAFQTFAVQTQQHLIELRDQVSQDVTAIGASAREAISEMSESSRLMVHNQSLETVDEIRKVASSVGRLVKSIDRHSDALGEVGGKTSKQLEDLAAIEKAGAAAADALTQITGSAEMVHRYQVAANDSNDKLVAAGASMASAVGGISQATERFEVLIEQKINALGKAPMDISGRLDAELTEALNRWQQTISRCADENAGFLDALRRAREAELEAARRHNEALEAEVERSREKVGLVHNSLVDMTNELTSQLSNDAR